MEAQGKIETHARTNGAEEDGRHDSNERPQPPTDGAADTDTKKRKKAFHSQGSG